MMPELLRDDIALVEGEKDKLAAVFGFEEVHGPRWRELWTEAEAACRAKLQEAGAKLGFQGSAVTIRFRGLSASSEMGLSGALGNWANAARKRLSSTGDPL